MPTNPRSVLSYRLTRDRQVRLDQLKDRMPQLGYAAIIDVALAQLREQLQIPSIPAVPAAIAPDLAPAEPEAPTDPRPDHYREEEDLADSTVNDVDFGEEGTHER